MIARVWWCCETHASILNMSKHPLESAETQVPAHKFQKQTPPPPNREVFRCEICRGTDIEYNHICSIPDRELGSGKPIILSYWCACGFQGRVNSSSL